MGLKVRGTIKKINDVQTGTSQKGEWKKLSFLLDNGAKYNNLFCLRFVWKDEKIDRFFKVQQRR